MLSAVINTEEKERKHFSKELHDGLGPLLSSAKMTLSAMDRSHMPMQNKNILNKAENMVECAIATTREISNHLTPSVLERYGLKKAIETFVRNTDLKDSIDISIESNIVKKRYNLNLEVILYRVCCELINNTLKHAGASSITLHLHDRSDVLELLYKDNGLGFEKMDENHGMGLNNIRSRVKSLNGSIELISSPGKGFQARIELPL
ncbi:MAG: histidine kinase [Bacteroidales bacterium]|nr:histidine kinase [Bacteroidales bacterium]